MSCLFTHTHTCYSRRKVLLQSRPMHQVHYSFSCLFPFYVSKCVALLAPPPSVPGMVLQYFVTETDDVLSLVVVDELKVLQRRYSVLLPNAGPFTYLTAGRPRKVKVINYIQTIKALTLYFLHVFLWERGHANCLKFGIERKGSYPITHRPFIISQSVSITSHMCTAGAH